VSDGISTQLRDGRQLCCPSASRSKFCHCLYTITNQVSAQTCNLDSS